jgi:hypothetical protein
VLALVAVPEVVESVRSTILAYGRGEIELPKVPKGTDARYIRHTSETSLTFTKATVATFLGWTSKAHKDGIRPNYACEVAFAALDAIELIQSPPATPERVAAGDDRGQDREAEGRRTRQGQKLHEFRQLF